jgi:hypothetical protein
VLLSMLMSCAEGVVNVPGTRFDPDVAVTVDAWVPFAGSTERAAGRWTEVDPSYEDVDAYRSDDAFGPYALAPYDTCDPRDAQCTWERDDVSVDWYAAPTEEDDWPDLLFHPAVRIGARPPMVPSVWMRDVVWTYHARRYEGVPTKGCATLRGNGTSGGMHCCTLNLLVTVCPDGRSVTLIDTQDGSGNFGAKFVDVDDDGTYEFAATDWSWGSTGSLDFSSTPPIWRILAWGPDGWTLPPTGRFQRFYEEQEREANRDHEQMFHDADGDRFTERGVAVRHAMTAASYAALGGASEDAVGNVVAAALSTYDHADDPLDEMVGDASAQMRGYGAITPVYATRSEGW